MILYGRKVVCLMTVLASIVASQLSYGQNNPKELDLEIADAVAFQKYVDGYDFSALEGVEGNKADIVVNHFISEYLVMQRHFDKKCLRLGENGEYYYAATMSCSFMDSENDGNASASDMQGTVSAGEASDLADLSNEEFNYYEGLGLTVYSMRGGVPLPSAYFSKGAGNNSPQMREVSSIDRRSTSSGEKNTGCQIELQLKPIAPDITISPILEKDSNPSVGSEIPFTVHVGWRGLDIDKAKLNFESNGQISLDKKDAVSGADGNCSLTAKINDYGLYQITAIYSVHDAFWGEMAVEYNYYFSLKKDERWAFHIAASDRMSQPFYDYTLDGEMQFDTFKYGKSNYRVYEEVLLELDVTKEKQSSEEDEVSIPVAYIGASSMTTPDGVTDHSMTASKVSYDGEKYEAIMLFDVDKYASYGKQAEAEVGNNVQDALLAALFSSADTTVESAVCPIWAVRLPLRNGSQQFKFAFGDADSMTFGVKGSDAAAMAMSNGAVDVDSAKKMLAKNDGCAIIPNPLRMVQMLQTGNLLMMFASGMEDGNGSISGTVTLEKIEIQ